MYTISALETKFLSLLKSSPELSKNQIYNYFEDKIQAERVIEGCLIKGFVEKNPKKRHLHNY